MPSFHITECWARGFDLQVQGSGQAPNTVKCWRMMYGGRFGEPKTSADMHLKVRYGGKLSEKGSSVDEPESASVSRGAGVFRLRMSG